MSLTLLILAAGLGSRFGGNKQLEGVGPDGQAFFDYSIYDATNAGFDRVVMVTRTDIEQMTRDHIARTQPADLDITYVRQDELGPPREKPWGTGHAVLAAAPVIDGPFAMINADDYYGIHPYGQLAELLRSPEGDVPIWSLVAYRLDTTLSPTGAVTRGLCETADGKLVSINETSGIELNHAGAIVDDDGDVWPDDMPTSMNFWGFTPEMFDFLRTGFDEFLETNADDPKAEFLIPDVVDQLKNAGAVEVLAATTDSRWLGITHRSDLEPAREEFARLHAEGIYPEHL
jgi:NDP-sugar pyrophosphorylase family protein